MNIKKYIQDDSDKNIINLDDIIELTNIFVEHCYDFMIFNNYDDKISNHLIQRQSKNIFDRYNVFLLTSGFYDQLNIHIHNISKFCNLYRYILEQDDHIDAFKTINKLLNTCETHNLDLDLSEVNSDICNCGNKMVIKSNSSELICPACGYMCMIIGTVFEDSQFYNQENGNRYKHANYLPSRHCKFWIDRIQAKENTVIAKEDIEKINYCIKRDNIKNKKNISIEQFRSYLKECKLSKLNDHLPLIKKIITGVSPPQLTYNEIQTLYNYFDKAIKTYNVIKPKDKKNFLYYPFLLYKLLDLIITDKYRRISILSCIHLQGYETLTYNDSNWYNKNG